MRKYIAKSASSSLVRVLAWSALGAAMVSPLAAQEQQPSLATQVQQLTEAMARAQARIEESQRELSELRARLAGLQQQLSSATPPAVAPAPAPAEQATAVGAPDDLHERQAMSESQIATLDQVKVESESKYPVKISGMLLFNGFVNTSQVDSPSTPSVAIGGPGSTGASVKQTILGIEARGPHLLGATTSADLHVDFDGNGDSYGSAAQYAVGYGGYSNPLLRLRTAHAALEWQRTRAFFAYDRPLVSPLTPASLTAVALPALSWSGNLWTWNPQVGVSHDLALGSHALRVESALIDVGDAPLLPVSLPPSGASTGEHSRWPGVETHLALLGDRTVANGNQIGVGGYFAPHRTALGYTFDSWAATVDVNLHLPARLLLSGSAYRGLALGGLGGGTYKDFVYRVGADSGDFYYRALDNVGGWVQLKESFSRRFEANAAAGFDQVFAGQLYRYFMPGGSAAQNLARNRTFTGNVIYSPSAYLLFSLEYRRLDSAPVVGSAWGSNVFGIAAGYKF